MRFRVGISFLFLFSVSTVFSNDLDDALSYERAGEIGKALPLYLNWLDANSGDVKYQDVLIHTATLYDNPLDTLKFLDHSLSKLRPNLSSRVLALMAGLESSLGMLEQAAIHFREAAESGSGDSDQWNYDSLSLRFVMGEYEELRPEALELSLTAGDKGLREGAAALAALSLAYSGNSRESNLAALDEINRYINKNTPIASSSIWLALYKIASLSGDQQAAGHALKILSENFPSSLDSYIAIGKLPEWNTPAAYVFVPEESGSKLKSLQIAAFSSRDAAAALRYRLEEDNFTAWIEQSGSVWRVFVNDPDGEVISRLKAVGGYELLF